MTYRWHDSGIRQISVIHCFALQICHNKDQIDKQLFVDFEEQPGSFFRLETSALQLLKLILRSIRSDSTEFSSQLSAGKHSPELFVLSQQGRVRADCLQVSTGHLQEQELFTVHNPTRLKPSASQISAIGMWCVHALKMMLITVFEHFDNNHHPTLN